MTSCLPNLLSLCLMAAASAAVSAETKPDALQTIESTRGGRHWIDDKMAPPKSPAESLACLQIEPGLEIQLVAAEPLVMDPVEIAFDHLGRMFVVEYGDYPNGPEKEGDPPLSRVVFLEDVDGDGCVDKRHVFADHLTFAHGIMPFQGGLLVGANTQILFLKDTNGDNKADVRKVLFDGFVPAHPQMQIGNPRWGLDNWIYLSYGPGKITSAQSSEVFEMPQRDFRFHPLTMQFGPDSGLGQFGNTIDNWGRRFFCTNRNPIMTTMLSYAAVQRNPFAIIPKAYYDVAPSGGDSRVYPLIEMKSNYLSHAGSFTSACGTTAYRGDLLDPKYWRSIFVCEPIGHLVTRSVVSRQGHLLKGKRARPKTDFLASTDTWFRPVNLANGPDGALYVVDMYRKWVEHPLFLPADIAKRIDWRAGDNRGRIYRILPKGAAARKTQPPKTTEDLVTLLSDTNGWCRQLAQRLLVERQSKDAVGALRELLVSSNFALTRIHALWTLDGLNELKVSDVRRALGDSDVHVRCEAIKLAAQFLNEHSVLLDKLSELVDDQDSSVRFQVALVLGETNDLCAIELLTRLAVRDGRDHWFTLAILSAAKERSGAILAGLFTNSTFSRHGDAQRIDLVRQLATVVGARGDSDELAALFTAIGATDPTSAWWQMAALSGLATGLPRHQGELGRTSLESLIANPPKQLDKSLEHVRRQLDRIENMAINDELDVSDRVAAIQLLGYQPFEESIGVYHELLSSNQPVEVQLACIGAIRTRGDERGARVVLDRWLTLSPIVRGSALTLLWQRPATIRLVLKAMSDGRISASTVSIDRRVQLLTHADKHIRRLATRLFGDAVSTNRRAVAETYRPALHLKASAAAGSKVFQRTCSSCHRINGKGHVVGPDLDDIRNRSREAVLYDILDPNLKVDPQFTHYIVLTDDGRVLNGQIKSETADAVILHQAEGKQQIIPRNEIEEIQATGKSLMPEGIEKEVSVQQMADLLEFLKPRP